MKKNYDKDYILELLERIRVLEKENAYLKKKAIFFANYIINCLGEKK